MDIYRNTLLLLKDLLHKSGDTHWEQWIDRDIVEWDRSKSTSQHKNAFGGMGSINDLAVGGKGKIGMWKNNMFDLLKIISWTFATKNKIQYPTMTIEAIEGAICRDCSYAEISETEVENYLSKKYLPAIISNLLPTDDYVELTNIEKLTEETQIAINREEVLAALLEFKINFTKNHNWLETCPACNSNNTCVYRWDIVNRNNKLAFLSSKNNLAVNFNKAKESWWKRLIN